MVRLIQILIEHSTLIVMLHRIRITFLLVDMMNIRVRNMSWRIREHSVDSIVKVWSFW